MASAEELEGKSLTSKSDDENTDPRMASLIAAKTIVFCLFTFHRLKKYFNGLYF